MMTVQQVIDSLQKEKDNGVTSRFPCRAIMVKNIKQYVELISRLHEISDIQDVSTAELFSSADVMPRYENLTDSKYKDKWVILTGVSEYLRLFGKSEAINPRFSKLWSNQVDAQSRGRILIPLWGCESQWHDPELHLCDDIRQEDYFISCVDEYAEDSVLNILVLSGDFEQHIASLGAQHGHMCFGLQEWFEYWQSPNINQTKLILLTRRYSKIQPTLSNISIRVISDSLSFVRENLKGGQVLSKENCGEQAITILFEYALNGDSVDTALLSGLNTVSFSGPDLMGQWNGMSEGKRQLMSLWYQLHPDNTYLYHCFQEAASFADLPIHIMHDIFSLRTTHPEWVEEHKKLVVAINGKKDDAYFSELDKMPDYSERLKYLNGKSKAERVYLLRMIGKWMRQDISQVLACEELKYCYPELHAYLDDHSCPFDIGLRDYFARYKSYKLENSLPMDEEVYFAGAEMDSVEMRYSKLSDAIDSNTIILWVDALGAEWIPLLTWSLKNRCIDAKVQDICIAQATLPTETCFNDQWNQMTVSYKKLDKLDKLAHKGIIDDPDYYACIEDQMAFVSGLAAEVSQLLKSHHRVVITGDHGTSRLAARFFHKREGISVPKGVKVCSHGRYCEISKNVSLIDPKLIPIKSDGEVKYQVFRNYDHFTQSGFAAGADDDQAIYGEVHGGATPEEMLIPVIVIDSTKEMPLSAEWDKATVKIMMKKAKATLCFNKPVSMLQAKIESIAAVCVGNSDNTKWTLTFAGAKEGTYSVIIVADGKIVEVQALTIKSALGGGNGDLP